MRRGSGTAHAREATQLLAAARLIGEAERVSSPAASSANAKVQFSLGPEDEAILAELITDPHDLYPGRWYRGQHLAVLSLVTLLLPVDWIRFVAATLGDSLAGWLWPRHDDAALARSHALDMATFLALAMIPVLAVVASAGAAAAFYLWAKPNKSSWAGNTDHAWALNILLLSVFVPLIWILFAIRMLIRHRGNAQVLPFEPDVDAATGAEKLREWRLKRASHFLPGRDLFAASRVNQRLKSGVEASGTRQAPTFIDALKGVWREPRDRVQLVFLAAMAVVWNVVPDALDGRIHVRLLLLTALSIVTLVTFGAADANERYRVRLNWVRREESLRLATKARDSARPVRAVDLAPLVEGIRAIRDDIRQLRSAASAPAAGIAAALWPLAKHRHRLAVFLRRPVRTKTVDAARDSIVDDGREGDAPPPGA